MCWTIIQLAFGRNRALCFVCSFLGQFIARIKYKLLCFWNRFFRKQFTTNNYRLLLGKPNSCGHSTCLHLWLIILLLIRYLTLLRHHIIKWDVCIQVFVRFFFHDLWLLILFLICLFNIINQLQLYHTYQQAVLYIELRFFETQQTQFMWICVEREKQLIHYVETLSPITFDNDMHIKLVEALPKVKGGIYNQILLKVMLSISYFWVFFTNWRHCS